MKSEKDGLATLGSASGAAFPVWLLRSKNNECTVSSSVVKKKKK